MSSANRRPQAASISARYSMRLRPRTCLASSRSRLTPRSLRQSKSTAGPSVSLSTRVPSQSKMTASIGESITQSSNALASFAPLCDLRRLVFLVRSFEIVNRAAVEVPHPGADFLQQILVVRHQEDRALVFLQRHVQRVDRFQIEVVGRLVEHQHVRLLQHDPAEEQARRLATGQGLGRLEAFLAAEQHLPEQPVNVLA